MAGAREGLSWLAAGLVAAVLALPASAFGAATCLEIGIPTGAGAGQEIAGIAREIGKRAGQCVEPVRAPMNRLHEMAIDGEILALPDPPGDGDALIPVPTPIATFTGMLYWPAGRLEPSGPDALIGVVLGQDWALRATESRNAKPYEVRDNKQLFEMMDAGRLDGMILPANTFRHFLPRYPLLASCKAKTLSPLPVLFLFDRKHAALIPRFDRALQRLRREGYVDAIFKRYAP